MDPYFCDGSGTAIDGKTPEEIRAFGGEMDGK